MAAAEARGTSILMTSTTKQNDDSIDPVSSSLSIVFATSSSKDGMVMQSPRAQDEKHHNEAVCEQQQEGNGLLEPPQQTSISKNAMKRKLKFEKVKEYRKKQKEEKKELKRTKAVAQGRNLEEERKQLEERTRLGGEGRKRREEIWKAKFNNNDSTASFGVCIDCAYEDQMTEKEINSLAQQIRYCYAQNKRSTHPCRFVVANLEGKTNENLKKESGFPDHWKARGFECSDKPLSELFLDCKPRLVYLSSDSDNVLEHLSNDEIYVIGGIVDRNRLTRAAISRAESLGIKTAKLPIDQYVKLSATKVLTCNHVFQILLKYRELGNNWKQAIMEILPQRKTIKEIIDDGSDEKLCNL